MPLVGYNSLVISDLPLCRVDLAQQHLHASPFCSTVRWLANREHLLAIARCLSSPRRTSGFPFTAGGNLQSSLAKELGLDFTGHTPVDLAKIFSGQSLLPEMVPLAQAYAGHQFGSFTMLGDGRAILLAEHRTPTGNCRCPIERGRSNQVFLAAEMDSPRSGPCCASTSSAKQWPP